jgi:pimeloyl-ACP methyl ester carboxylesterase
MGSESPAWLQIGARAVAAALAHAQLKVLAGQEHHATLAAPDLFAQIVEEFAIHA